ncbi:MAG: hypothetical protein H7839_03610 [Magnetococcus sp. YQC-5]
MHQSIRLELEQILSELGRGFPKVPERVGVVTGLGIGGAASVGIQTVGGLGLAALGTHMGVVVGGVATPALLALAPVVLGGFTGYVIFRRYNHRKRKIASYKAIGKLYEILNRLEKDRQYFIKEINLVKKMIKLLEEIIIDSR